MISSSLLSGLFVFILETYLSDIERFFDLRDPAGNYLGIPGLWLFQKAPGPRPRQLSVAFLALALGTVRLSGHAPE